MLILWALSTINLSRDGKTSSCDPGFNIQVCHNGKSFEQNKNSENGDPSKFFQSTKVSHHIIFLHPPLKLYALDQTLFCEISRLNGSLKLNTIPFIGIIHIQRYNNRDCPIKVKNLFLVAKLNQSWNSNLQQLYWNKI